MKKTYKAPKVKTVNIRMGGVIATSPGVNEAYGKENGPRLGKERGDLFEEDETLSW